MSIEARKEYLKAIKERYFQSKKFEKSKILDEFCQTCNYSRKYAIRILNGRTSQSSNRPGPKVKYGPEFIYHLATLWKAMGNICSKKMVIAIPLWLPFYRPKNLSVEISTQLRMVSSATIDRCLKKHKEEKGLSGTTPSYFKNKIPLKLLSEEETKRPGFMEADTVAHCGQSLAGKFAWTLTMTDLYSGWTENRAVWSKESYPILMAVKEVDDNLPFNLHGFASDNGTEFLNINLMTYFKDREIGEVEFVRRRPYQKNDNAHVEQKNFTHVRSLFGYERIEDRSAIDVMNEIYKVYWNPMHNYFIPCLKLKSKERVGSKIKKKYEEAKTPYQRLLDSKCLRLEQEEKLNREYHSLNPFKLRDLLNKKLSQFYRILDTAKVRAS